MLLAASAVTAVAIGEVAGVVGLAGARDRAGARGVGVGADGGAGSALPLTIGVLVADGDAGSVEAIVGAAGASESCV